MVIMFAPLVPLRKPMALVCTMLSVLIMQGIDAITLVAVLGMLFAGISGITNLFLYGKLSKVEQNTNGTATDNNALIRELVDVLKKAPPI
jgi:hypothetical protein